MPHKKNFDEVINTQTIEINPQGWVNPLFVEYGIALHYNTPSYFWRVKGTSHTFVIPITRMEFLSSGDHKSHFEKSLEKFREDYIEWKSVNFISDWMAEYREEYKKFII